MTTTSMEAGKWWRFSDYLIRDGLILPSPGATLESYDPWEGYAAAQRRGATAETPYQSLVRLVAEVDFQVGGRLRPEGRAAILAWCRQYGLLGLLPHYYDLLPAGVDLVDDRRFYWSYVWDAGEWEKVTDSEMPWMYRSTEWAPLGNRVSVAKEEDLLRFFPRLPHAAGNELDLPEPLSHEFWEQYGEPVHQFMEEAYALNGALESLATIPKNIGRETIWHDADGRRWIDFSCTDFVLGLDTLNRLTSTVVPILKVVTVGAKATLAERWVFRSLLASLGMMAHQDLLSGDRMYLCANCGTPFPSTSPNASYCSLKCRNTAQKRRWRERKKAAKEAKT